jgi:hypothetical protein
MKQTQEQIEKLKTLQETSSFWADVAENQLPALADKIDNIKLPEIDTTNIASKDVEKFFGLPAALPEGYEFMTAEEICAELEEIMTSMDLGLTQEMVTNITQNTLKQFGNE